MKALGTVLILLAAATAPLCGATETTVTQKSGGDVYSAGASVQVDEPVAGDAVLAGGTILLTESVAQDVLAAGGSLTLTGRIDDDLRAAGGSITVTDNIGGDAILAGGTVTFSAGSVVGGNAWVAGGVLRLSGTVQRDIRAAGGEVVISGTVNGDADIYSESLEVRPGTVIDGTLHYRGPNPPKIAEDARIGEVVYTKGAGFERPGMSIVSGLLASLVFFLSLAVCALLLAWLVPNMSREAANHARTRMLASLGVGILTVIVTPIVVAVLFALLVTGPLGVALVAAYILVLVLGALIAVSCLGGWLRRRFMAARSEGAGVQILSVLVAALVYWLVGLVPFIGAVIVMLAFVTGVGALILSTSRLYKQSESS